MVLLYSLNPSSTGRIYPHKLKMRGERVSNTVYHIKLRWMGKWGKVEESYAKTLFVSAKDDIRYTSFLYSVVYLELKNLVACIRRQLNWEYQYASSLLL
jgi:hypothetical protein